MTDDAALAGPAPEPPDPFRAFLDDWLQRAPPELAVTARLAALPHAFDLALLSALRGETTETENHVAQLLAAGLVERAGANGYVFQSTLRRALLDGWRQADAAGFRQASARAAAALAATQSTDPVAVAERVYHELGAGDARGLAALGAAADEARAGHALGQLELLVSYAEEQRPVLGREATGWLRLHRARLDLATGGRAAAEAALTGLLAENTSGPIRLPALLALTDVLLADQRWAESLPWFDEALRAARSAGDSQVLALVHEARALAYLRLTSWLGGLPAVAHEPMTFWRRVWRIYATAPFLLYRWFSRRLSFLPNVYFGTDYQDWIIARLLLAAERELRAAARHLRAAPAPSPGRTLAIQLRLADLAQRLDRWTRAAQLRRQAADSPLVRDSAYQRAVLGVVEGRAAVDRRAWTAAIQSLQPAYTVLTGHGDRDNAARAAALLAQAMGESDDRAAAVGYYAEAARLAVEGNDLLFATDNWYRLADLRRATPEANPPSGAALEASMTRRAYIGRFPGGLGDRFRRLATYVALPVAYLTAQFLRLLLSFVLGILELTVQVGPLAFVALAEMATALAAVALITTATIWTYELIYVLAGAIIARRLSLADLAGRQPAYVITTPQGILERDETGATVEMAWGDVTAYVTADRGWRTRPLALFSRSWLLSPPARLRIEGVVSHYRQLQAEIGARLSPAAARRSFDVFFFAGRTAWLAGALTIGLALVEFLGVLDYPEHELIVIGVLRANGQVYDLYVTSLIFHALKWAFLLFPLTGLIQIVAQRRALRAAVGAEALTRSTWPLWLAIVVLSALVAMSIWSMAR